MLPLALRVLLWGGGISRFPKASGLAPTAASGAFTGEMQAQTVALGLPGEQGCKGSRGSQMGFLNESVLCIFSALEERQRSKFTGARWGGIEKIYFPGGKCTPPTSPSDPFPSSSYGEDPTGTWICHSSLLGTSDRRKQDFI